MNTAPPAFASADTVCFGTCGHALEAAVTSPSPMPPRDLEHAQILDDLRAAGSPTRGPEFEAFYRHLETVKVRVLAKFRQLSEEDRDDLFHDTLTNLREILGADDPVAFFVVALRRRAISHVRAPKNLPKTPLDGDADRPGGAVDATARKLLDDWAAGGGHDPGFVLDARGFLAGLPERSSEILYAVALGEDREAIGRRFGTSRVNVDQIVSRARKAFEADR